MAFAQRQLNIFLTFGSCHLLRLATSIMEWKRLLQAPKRLFIECRVFNLSFFLLSEYSNGYSYLHLQRMSCFQFELDLV